MIIKVETGQNTFSYYQTDTGSLNGKQTEVTEQEAIDSGEDILDFEDSPAAVDKAEDEERAWRNSELLVCDIEINKLEDIALAFDATEWRSYRQLLRDWPANVDFPDKSKRPVLS